MTVLKLIDVKYKYEGSNRYTLKGINIEFEKGKIYTIIGRSGSGKSTLLSILSGLDDCSSGSIFFKDKELKDINRDIYRTNDIGIVFKENYFLNDTSVLDNIILAMSTTARENKHKREIAYKLLKNLNISEEEIKSKVADLSNFEKKKVAVARSLINNPDIIVTDDPTESLDEEESKYIMAQLSNLARIHDKSVIILSSSDLVTSYGDELWGLVNGKVMFVKDIFS